MDNMEGVMECLKHMPDLKQIEYMFNPDKEAKHALRLAITNFAEMREKYEMGWEDGLDEEAVYYIKAVRDHYWEKINTGFYCDLPKNTKKIYALLSIIRSIHLYMESDSGERLQWCSELLDEAVLQAVVDDLYEDSKNLRKKYEALLNLELNAQFKETEKFPIFFPLQRREYACDILCLDCPSLSEFKEKCFSKELPALLFNTLHNWPASEKWRDLSYINQVAGNRLVPVEIGQNYATNNWTQRLEKVRDFLKSQFIESPTDPKDIAYLAQHDLFNHIPDLMNDIRIPPYCELNETGLPLEIKAWLGPKGTISPMHYDKKYNFLCQVFGAKTIILASPQDSENLYPFDNRFLENTSQVDAENVDFEQFPLTKNVKFYKLKLQEGDCLYIPPLWWHYVRAETPSFSVSFWWNLKTEN